MTLNKDQMRNWIIRDHRYLVDKVGFDPKSIMKSSVQILRFGDQQISTAWPGLTKEMRGVVAAKEGEASSYRCVLTKVEIFGKPFSDFKTKINNQCCKYSWDPIVHEPYGISFASNALKIKV